MSVFSLVQEATGDEPRSYEWYRNTVRTIFKQSDLFADLAELEETLVPSPGSLYLFEYRAVYAERLNFYDRFPLVLPIEQYSDGFLGINFHYLSMPIRIRLLDRIMTFANNKSLDETTVINANYSALKRVREIKPCLKRYLSSNVRSRFRKINANEFVVAVLLPVARFKKKGESFVHAKSRGMI